jgi:acetylornithine/N-succinyldiaminopimelate aminotransferase
MGSVTATAQPKYHEGLGPMLAGFQYAPHGDLDAVEKLVDDQHRRHPRRADPRRGGRGARAARLPRGPAADRDERDLLLVFDEVQCGCGRTGKWFGYQHFGVTPDVITLAKSLCAGIAGGAMLTTVDLAKHLRPGMHAATFGGNPIAAAAGVAAIRMIEDEASARARRPGGRGFSARGSSRSRTQCDAVRDVRVIGMMIGVELSIDGAAVVQACLDRNLLVNARRAG